MIIKMILITNNKNNNDNDNDDKMDSIILKTPFILHTSIKFIDFVLLFK